MRQLRRHYGQWMTWMFSSRMGRGFHQMVDVCLTLAMTVISGVVFACLFLCGRLLFVGIVYGATFFLVSIILIFPVFSVLLTAWPRCISLWYIVRMVSMAFRHVVIWTIQGICWWCELTSFTFHVVSCLGTFLRRARTNSVLLDILVARLPADVSPPRKTAPTITTKKAAVGRTYTGLFGVVPAFDTRVSNWRSDCALVWRRRRRSDRASNKLHVSRTVCSLMC